MDDQYGRRDGTKR